MTINVLTEYNFRCAERHYSNHTDNDQTNSLLHSLHSATGQSTERDTAPQQDKVAYRLKQLHDRTQYRAGHNYAATGQSTERDTTPQQEYSTEYTTPQQVWNTAPQQDIWSTERGNKGFYERVYVGCFLSFLFIPIIDPTPTTYKQPDVSSQIKSKSTDQKTKNKKKERWQRAWAVTVTANEVKRLCQIQMSKANRPIHASVLMWTGLHCLTGFSAFLGGSSPTPFLSYLPLSQPAVGKERLEPFEFKAVQ